MTTPFQATVRAPDGDTRGHTLLLFFSLTRTDISKVRIEGRDVHGVPVPGFENLFLFAPSDSPLDREVRVLGEYAGQRPFASHLVALERGEPPGRGRWDPPGSVIALAVRSGAAVIRDNLRARLAAAEKDQSKKPARRFFLRYDALTIATVVENHGDVVHGYQELEELLELPSVPFDRDVFDVMRIKLVLDILTRAGCYKQGKQYQSSYWDATKAGVELTPGVKSVADYQMEIFRAHPPAKLEAFFTDFAVGELRYAKPLTPGYLSFNAEPDGALFFAFAEFALLASDTAHGALDRSTWARLFQRFVMLEEVYVAAYGPRVAPWDWSAYSLDKCGDCPRPLTEEELEELEAHYAGLEWSEIVWRHASNSYCAFRDTSTVANTPR